MNLVKPTSKHVQQIHESGFGFANGADRYPYPNPNLDLDSVNGALHVLLFSLSVRGPIYLKILKKNANGDNMFVGVKGLVRDASSLAPVAAATVAVSGRLHTTQTTPNGEFWRLLLPGAYVINVRCLLKNLYFTCLFLIVSLGPIAC